MHLKQPLLGSVTVVAMLLAACGGSAAPSSSAPASSAAPKPASSAPASASAKPSSVAASASAKPSGPAPTPTTMPPVAADETNAKVTKIAIPALNGKALSADIMEVDQQAHRLYLADRTTSGVDVFDVSTPTAKYVKTIKTSDGANGVTVAKNVNKLFAGLNNSHVAIIDIDPTSAKADTVITELNTGGKKRADEMDYDPKEKKLYVANSDDAIVTAIDAVNNKIIKKFDNLGPGLEQPRYDPTDGMMYLTGSEENVIFQFDPSKDVLVKKTNVGDPCNPNGLAINPTTNQALLGCSNKKQPQHAAVWDFKAGKVVATIDNVGAGDAAIYDAKADRYFFGASNFFRGPQMGIFNGKDGKFITDVPTGDGAHMVAYDETNKIVYTADRKELLSFPLPTTTGAAAGSAGASAKPAGSSSAASAKPSA